MTFTLDRTFRSLRWATTADRFAFPLGRVVLQPRQLGFPFDFFPTSPIEGRDILQLGIMLCYYRFIIIYQDDLQHHRCIWTHNVVNDQRKCWHVMKKSETLEFRIQFCTDHKWQSRSEAKQFLNTDTFLCLISI